MPELTERDHLYYLHMGEMDARNRFWGGHFESTPVPFTGAVLDEYARQDGAGFPYYLKGDALLTHNFGFKREYVSRWNASLGMSEPKLKEMARALAAAYISLNPDCDTRPLDYTFDMALKQLKHYRAYIPDFDDTNTLFMVTFVNTVCDYVPAKPKKAGLGVSSFFKPYKAVVRKPAAI